MRISKRLARKKALINGFRSNFEYEIAKFLDSRGIPYQYEKLRLHYIVPETKRAYTPDWIINENPDIVYESKGRFTSADRKKMLLVRKANPAVTIRMVFQNSDVRISKSSKTSYADWCNKNGVEWCDWRKGLPKGWLKL